jgi:hypothetical protein
VQVDIGKVQNTLVIVFETVRHISQKLRSEKTDKTGASIKICNGLPLIAGLLPANHCLLCFPALGKKSYFDVL